MTDPQLNFFTNRRCRAPLREDNSKDSGKDSNKAPGSSVSRPGTNARQSRQGLRPDSGASRSKYGNRATGGHASRKEHRRALELQLLQRAGQITDLCQQVPFILIPAQYAQPDAAAPTPCGAQGATLTAQAASVATCPDRAFGPSNKPRLLERPCTYIADFVYTDVATGRQIVEDTKGMRTDVYRIKRKLMLYIHGIQIKET